MHPSVLRHAPLGNPSASSGQVSGQTGQIQAQGAFSLLCIKSWLTEPK